MTVEGDQQTKAADPQASLRAELVGQLVAAQFDLESAIADMMRNGAPASAMLDSRSQLGSVIALRQQVAGADVKTLAAMRSDIAAMVAASQTAAQEAQQTAAGGNGGAVSLASARQVARKTVDEFEDAYFKQRKFDPYLQFQSEEDEKAYREREAERQKEIERAKSLHTPEGDLQALRLSKAQLLDAGAHGADRSPDYAPTLERMNDAERNLVAAKDVASPSKEQAGQHDPFDDVAPSRGVSPAILANLRAAGVTIPASGTEGHGLSVAANTANVERTRG